MTAAKKLAPQEVLNLSTRDDEVRPTEPPTTEAEAKAQIQELIRRHKKALDALAKL